MTYRDRFEQCPRCRIDLVDARSARGCRQCGGMWLREDVLTEMVLAMLPGQTGRLAFVDLQRAADPDRPTLFVAESSTEETEPPRLRFRVRFGESFFDRELCLPVIKIGRLPSSHLQLPEACGASRMHAVIEASPDGTVTIIDLGSAVATTVNGNRINKAQLGPGDVVGIGTATIEISLRELGDLPSL